MHAQYKIFGQFFISRTHPSECKYSSHYTGAFGSSHIPYNWSGELNSLKCRDSRSRKVNLTLRRRVELFSCISPLARFKGFPLVPLVAFFSSLFSCVISNAASLDTKRIRQERRERERRKEKREEEIYSQEKRMNGPEARVKMKTNVH